MISIVKISVFVPCGYTQSLLFEVECSLCLFTTTLLDFIHKFCEVQLYLPEFAQDVQVLPYLPIWCLKDLVMPCLSCSEVHTKLVARSTNAAYSKGSRLPTLTFSNNSKSINNKKIAIFQPRCFHLVSVLQVC